jgi:uncharacterized protein (DUF1778 family)
MTKSKKNKNKAKLNLTVRDEQRNKLEQMASLENRSVSNLIEVMADERWERLVEQQGIAYAKTVAQAMNLKLDADTPADREKTAKAKRAWLKFSRSLCADNLSKAGWSLGCASAVDSNGRTIWIVDGHRDDGQRFVVARG